MQNLIKGTFATDSGTLGVWNPSGFPMVTDCETWDSELCEDEDMLRHVRAGDFVPVGIDHGADGAFGVVVRRGTDKNAVILTARERAYLLTESQPFLFVTSGLLCLSGLEHVCSSPGSEVGVAEIEAGRYAVKIFLIAWDQEPGMSKADGSPKKKALPDFVVHISPETGVESYRQSVYALDPAAA